MFQLQVELERFQMNSHGCHPSAFSVIEKKKKSEKWKKKKLQPIDN